MGLKHNLLTKKSCDENGAALFTSIFGLLLLTVLAASLYAVSDGARKTAVNFAESNEAFYIAEAGMAHATGLYVLNGQTYNINTNIPLSGVDFGVGKYVVTAVTGTEPNTIKVISTGHGSNNSSATVEATLQFTTSAASDAAIVVNGSINIGGGLKILGSQGVIHANGTMNLSGNNRAQKYYSATGTITRPNNQPCPNGSVTGAGSSCDPIPDIRQNQPQLSVPDIKPNDFFTQADYSLYPQNGSTPARITDKDGNVVANNCHSGCWNGWTWNSGQGWVINSNSNLPAGTYYAVNSSLQVNKTFGSSSNGLNISFVADGHISFSGGASYMNPKASLGGRKFAVVAGYDVSIQGANLNTTNNEGTFYARHQFNLAGGQPKIFGNIFVLNEADSSFNGQNMVQRQNGNSFMASGDPQVTFNGNSASSGSGGTVQISTWREVRN